MMLHYLSMVFLISSAGAVNCNPGDAICKDSGSGTTPFLLQHEATKKQNKTKQQRTTCPDGRPLGCKNEGFQWPSNDYPACPMPQTCDAGDGEVGCCCNGGNPFVKCGASPATTTTTTTTTPASGTCPDGRPRGCTNDGLATPSDSYPACPLWQTCDAGIGETGCCCKLGNPFNKCTASPPSPSKTCSDGTKPTCSNPPGTTLADGTKGESCAMFSFCDAAFMSTEPGCCSR